MQTRLIALFACCLFPLALTADDPVAPGKTEKSEAPAAKDSAALAWAREIAEAFLKAGIFAPGSEAWTSADLKKRIEAAGSPPVTYTYKAWGITDSRVAPDSGEVIFKGTVEATSRIYYYQSGSSSPTKATGSISFTMRVAKERETERWRVDAVQFETPETKP